MHQPVRGRLLAAWRRSASAGHDVVEQGRRLACALWLPGRRIPVVAGLAALVTIVAAIWWPRGTTQPPPRARQYLAFNACLLTDSHGITAGDAAAAWAGMQRASLATRAKVSWLATGAGASPRPTQQGAVGPGLTATTDAGPYLAGLVARHCDMIIAAGPAQTAAVAADANRFPKSRFVVIGAETTGPNVTALPHTTPADVTDRIDTLVRNTVLAPHR